MLFFNGIVHNSLLSQRHKPTCEWQFARHLDCLSEFGRDLHSDKGGTVTSRVFRVGLILICLTCMMACGSDDDSHMSPDPTPKEPTSSADVEFPQIIWPLDHPLHDKVYISNYVDLNSNENQTQDYNCGFQHTYDGHTGTDFALLNFRIMDQGIGIVAVADGVVTWTEDFNVDRNYWPPYEGSHNGVVVQYPDNSITAYAHMRQNSVAVNVGETVKAGDFLGFVGSSGSSPIPHLHLANRDKNNAVVDPYSGACRPGDSFWVDQTPYVGNELRVYDADVFLDFTLIGGHQFGEIRTFKDRPLAPAVYGIDQPRLGFWVQVQGDTGHQFTIDIKRPDGTTFIKEDVTLETKRRYGWYSFNWDFSTVSEVAFGSWTATISGGVDEYEMSFEVGSETEFGPRFYPLAGKSIKTDGSITQEELILHESSPEVTFELVNAPPGVSISGNIITFGSGQTERNHHFQVKAVDSKGRYDLMYYHLIDLSKPL